MTRAPLDVLVVNYNTAKLLQPMFDALRQSNSADLTRYLVVDNASADNSLERLESVCPEALLLVNENNVGFGRANNQLVEHLQGKYALLINTDAFVAADTLKKPSTTWRLIRIAVSSAFGWLAGKAICNPRVATFRRR